MCLMESYEVNMKNKKQGNEKTIRSQILFGYILLTGTIVFLILVFIILFLINKKEQDKISTCQDYQLTLQEVSSAHYQWLEQLSECVTIGGEFSGSLDPDNCVLGQWIKALEQNKSIDRKVNELLNEFIQPHQEIHLTAKQLIELSKIDNEKAHELYINEYKKKVQLIGAGLNKIIDYYKAKEENLKKEMNIVYVICGIFFVIVAAIIVTFSILVGIRISDRIGKPVWAVQKWSEELASGVDNLKFDSVILSEKNNPVEIKKMIASFQEMADEIKNHVEVIKKVASGDLTAYVGIKSAGDSLGRNLYHLVQNNDIMFANLLNVADSVAISADSISQASQALAESSMKQANAVDVLSNTVEQANVLATENAESSNQATYKMNDMIDAVEVGQKRMEHLMNSVEEIQKASEKISSVMKAINDIAFQTNILSLNAAVEAARAGEAGKGFAVLASEVSKLAQRSIEAAKESCDLIENTINKTVEGNESAIEANQAFGKIVESVENVSNTIEEIKKASFEQQDYIIEVHDEIKKISSSVQDNAASSQETAAATQQMNASAELIRDAMYKFNLRKREPGRPYIPPEKENDEAFIQQAYKNYNKSSK